MMCGRAEKQKQSNVRIGFKYLQAMINDKNKRTIETEERI